MSSCSSLNGCAPLSRRATSTRGDGVGGPRGKDQRRPHTVDAVDIEVNSVETPRSGL